MTQIPKNDQRSLYLQEFARRIKKAGIHGLLAKVPFSPQVSAINGPRAAAILISAGGSTGEALKTLTRQDYALLRQLVPFHCPDHCLSAFLSSWYIRVEAGWPDDLADKDILLTSICQKPLGHGRWVTGVNEFGAQVIASLNDDTPHWLIAGTTGSGKSYAVRNAIYQLVMAGDCDLVLIDGKHGESLETLENLPGILGPCACDLESAKGALAYAVQVMTDRYASKLASKSDRLVVIFDEFQEYASDKMIANYMRKLTSQGRGARVHCIFATQHPVNAVLGDPQTKRNIPGRLVLKVSDYDASRVAIGQESPRADRLTGCGDCYVQGKRVQGAYVTSEHFGNIRGDPTHIVTDWCDFGMALEPVTKAPAYTAQEISNALLSALASEGRTLFSRRFDKPPGADRARRLLALGKDMLVNLKESSEVRL